MTAGRFITFEGGEGSGKSTQIKLLAEALGRRGLDLIVTREPGGTPAGERIRDILLGREHPKLDPMTEALLHFAARREHLVQVIWPALDRGTWVLCDRFADSTLAYQGHGLGLDEQAIHHLYRLAVGAFVPDHTIILDLPVASGLDRARKRNGTGDRYEDRDVAFHERLRQAYLGLARAEPARCAVIDASGPIARVHAAIMASVDRKFGHGQA
ncbi:MAG: dTMP kinase [Alphaproteobacteria bacterium]